MNSKLAITIRAKKLGVLIKDARQAAGKSKKDCGEAIGVSSSTINSFENGVKSPSLPELEMLAQFLNMPIEHFWKEVIRSDDPSLSESIHIEHHLSLRDRMIGDRLEAARNIAEFSLKDIREETGITQGRMKKYESGDSSTPLPELEILCALYTIRVQDLIAPDNPVGEWIHEQKAIAAFKQLPPEIQEFISQPVNKPYLELAARLSTLSTDQLRAVAEGLLEITI